LLDRAPLKRDWWKGQIFVVCANLNRGLFISAKKAVADRRFDECRYSEDPKLSVSLIKGVRLAMTAQEGQHRRQIQKRFGNLSPVRETVERVASEFILKVRVGASCSWTQDHAYADAPHCIRSMGADRKYVLAVF